MNEPLFHDRPSCSTCAFWASYYGRLRAGLGPYPVPPPAVERGECLATEAPEPVTYTVIRRRVAPGRPHFIPLLPSEEDNYRATLVTTADFHCAAWQARYEAATSPPSSQPADPEQ